MSSANNSISRRSFLGMAGFATLAMGLGLAGCSSGSSSSSSSSASASGSTSQTLDKITMVWLPNESSSEFDKGREEFGKMLEKFSGMTVELMTTTDYNICIEAIASGKAQLANMGAQGFCEAQKKNANVLPLVTTSDPDGKLDGAKYFSRICVPESELSNYKDSSSDTGYSLTNIKGKRMSFVSQESTSGFKVPADAIMKAFPDDVKSTDELATPGFFSEVLFGNSHPGSAVNLLQGDADVAAFDDLDVDTYLEVPSGDRDKVNQPGNVYSVKKDAAQPFDRVRGKKFGIISMTPVLNGPIAYNADALPDDIRQKLLDGLTSSECSNDELLFAPKEKDGNGAIWSKEDSKGFIAVENSWYDPIRKLSE
ncbi:MAG: phosphate/phosphite/phosphonate ABC transporter substrate-binding protein [Coriobacteriales bacterium]|jgi:phosphonate transport system substrate-binding protein